MSDESIARNYAAALFELAEREGEVERYGEGLETVALLLDEVPGFRTLLDTPRVARADKKRVLEEALGERIPEHVLHFLLIVLDKRRHRLLSKIAAEYATLTDDKLGRAQVALSLAREPGADELSEIQSQLSRILGREAIPHLNVRPELIGGIHFRSGDTIFDGSVRRRLQRMRRELLRADLPTDQG